jgi:hypothetical protein
MKQSTIILIFFIFLQQLLIQINCIQNYFAIKTSTKHLIIIEIVKCVLDHIIEILLQFINVILNEFLEYISTLEIWMKF